MVSGRSIFPLMAALAFLRQVDARCYSPQIECKTGGSCIYLSQVCSIGRECVDGSDEDPNICGFWKYDDIHCGYRSKEFFDGNSGSCYDVIEMCNNIRRSNQIDQRICKMVASNKLAYGPQPQPKKIGMTISGDILTNLSIAVNSTMASETHRCPMLYTPVGTFCLAFFSPAKVNWAEARQFCQSIYGDLVHFTNSETYGVILDYMKEALLTSSYWIGGRYDLDTNAWSWVHNDSPMPLGSPFWAQKYNSSCVPRSPPHTDPFSPPPDPLPGASCYYYVQAPVQRTIGWCSAMTYENFYYVTDEKCEVTHSPLCLLTDPA